MPQHPPHIVFDCEVLTPMFIAGAEQDHAAELRAPSIRGLLRYWYRALLGGKGWTGADLAKEEAVVFGSAGMGDVEASATGVDVLVREGEVHRKQAQQATGNKKGAAYLWHYTSAGDNDRGHFAPGRTFQVALIATRSDEEALHRAEAAFWLLATLGGIGYRSRRAAGAFDVLAVRGASSGKLSFTPPISGQVTSWLEDNMVRCLDLAPAAPAGRSDLRPAFDALHADHAQVWHKSYNKHNALDVVHSVGLQMQGYRCGSSQNAVIQTSRDETKALKRYLKDEKAEEVDGKLRRAEFGLPHALEFKKENRQFRGGKVFVNGSDEEDKLLTRRASPLHFTIVRTGDRRHDAVLTHFQSRFLPGDDTLFVSRHSPSPDTGSPNAELESGAVQDFLTSGEGLGLDNRHRISLS